MFRKSIATYIFISRRTFAVRNCFLPHPSSFNPSSGAELLLAPVVNPARRNLRISSIMIEFCENCFIGDFLLVRCVHAFLHEGLSIRLSVRDAFFSNRGI